MERKVYLLKQEFFKMLNINESQYKRRKEELMEWLKEFYDYEILDEKPIKICIKEVYGEYKALPHKKYDAQARAEFTKQKHDDYNDFTLAALTEEWKPNSKRKIARDAIMDFGNSRYGHTDSVGIARNYVGPIMDQYGIKTKETYWVWYDTYEVVDDETLEDWRHILEEAHISERDAANAFYRQEQGEDISEEKRYYKEARNIFKEKYGSFLVQVSKWKRR